MRIAKTALVVLALTLLTGALVLAHDNLTGEEIIEQLKSDMALTGLDTHADLITENKRGDRREHGLVLFRSDDGNTEKQLVEYTSLQTSGEPSSFPSMTQAKMRQRCGSICLLSGESAG